MNRLRKELNRLVGTAVHRYRLLEPGDRIAVAVSGGSDSLLALWFLRRWREKAPIRFSLLPVHLDMGFAGADTGALRAHLAAEGGFHMEETDYGPRAHGPENREKSPCFLCARLRRKRLFELAHRLGCNKLALGHNQDDILHTFFLNMLFGGELSTLVPRVDMFGGRLALIRPLALADKARIDRLARELGLPVVPNPCPSAGKTRREEVRRLLDGLFRRDPRIRGNLFHALSNVRPDYLL
ncbi:tRNA 2-thiocytidine(32) synthetase TtcA [Dissulfurirhabdus thermomarina]|uniref:tRNA 2-thiocytidine(32) synthetase TtcA n=1 Tax=Dissulfurirhabdus thermomarina TaxID=1765737 RepID=A0A6N9TRG1_DISTH|nr:ATP-binding protein [Dissulfurirhabdus thermomarina]NDY42344.1 tRNA 2-thiocytidine(32) synthetase TtcA [Dissulfurirhabdus thermomarina]NMX24220.1 tRNA 2-thiocytidine(32) synthetase TtcA [Dissulfurirhabdus thermomarina]